MSRLYGMLFLCLFLQIAPVALGSGIAETVHNLSVSGPGSLKASRVSDICLYCHAPHLSITTPALWNRDLPPTTYNLYSSSTLQAVPEQPTGASRLCLSCHDGTTALGSIQTHHASDPSLQRTLTGQSSLGLDLSDDHPISFAYDSSLALKNGELVPPESLGRELPLDSTAQMQCTSCHDPHLEKFRNFLRVDERYGLLCTTCHVQRGWRNSVHATSSAQWNGLGRNPWSSAPYSTVRENACQNCHQTHSAPVPTRLLKNTDERELCLTCHNGSVASKNVEREFRKTSAHSMVAPDWTHDPMEDPNNMQRHVSCVDCHNPHRSLNASATPPIVPGVLTGVRGVDIAGNVVNEAIREYEVCLKCHGDRDSYTSIGLERVDNIRSIRLEIDPGNPSYHPIVTTGKNSAKVRFEAGYSSRSMIYCTDCHNNDEWIEGGNAPRGPHGSRYAPLLEREYRMDDSSIESYQAYAMCYKCHNRQSLFRDRFSSSFSHNGHVRTYERTASCAVCHDAHGSRDNIALINFMTRDQTGMEIVKGVVDTNGRWHDPEYVSSKSAPDYGRCYLTCHGKEHNPL